MEVETRAVLPLVIVRLLEGRLCCSSYQADGSDDVILVPVEVEGEQHSSISLSDTERLTGFVGIIGLQLSGNKTLGLSGHKTLGSCVACCAQIRFTSVFLARLRLPL